MKTSRLALASLTVPALALGIGLSLALAQPSNVPNASPVLQSVDGAVDVIQVLPRGNPAVGNQYATVGAIAGTPGYQYLGTITTGNTFAVNNGTIDVFAKAAATLAAVTLTAPPNPGNGQRVCFSMNQITTLLTLTANTGQTVDGGAVATQALNTPACWTFVGATATWERSP